MEVYALTGHSGTGKSHHAPMVARNFGIDHIIDDGLLIRGNNILAGRSAKRENTRYGAIKRALFQDPEHAAQVRERLTALKPEKVLILGTSLRMTEVITRNLQLPAPSHYYSIEEVSDAESIKKALTVRARENRHVIPLPTFTIKKDFPGYIIAPLRSFFALPAPKSPDLDLLERSVIRPVFSTLGSFYIAEHVIIDLAQYLARSLPGVHAVPMVDLDNGGSRSCLEVDLILNPHDIPCLRIDTLLRRVQALLKEQIEYQTGFYLDRVLVRARKLYLGEENQANLQALQRLFTQ